MTTTDAITLLLERAAQLECEADMSFKLDSGGEGRDFSDEARSFRHCAAWLEGKQARNVNCASERQPGREVSTAQEETHADS